jgi:hypothetical protein
MHPATASMFCRNSQAMPAPAGIGKDFSSSTFKF